MGLTKTVLMGRSVAPNDPSAYFRDLGVTIALDDFGTGYASLMCLNRFQIDRLKVAMQFVQVAVTYPKDAAVVRASVGLARALGIDVIAEGAESSAQIDALRSAGCDLVRGYDYSRPVTAAAARLVRPDADPSPKAAQ